MPGVQHLALAYGSGIFNLLPRPGAAGSGSGAVAS
jgi:hypothetical protein